MTELSPPPLLEPMQRKPGDPIPLSWVEFFNNMYEGDAGNNWTPAFVNLTETGGSATKRGYYSRINQNIVYWWVTIIPVTSVSATAGSAYIEGFPLQFLYDSFCIGVSGGVGGTPGHVVAATQRIYIPTLSSVSVPVTFAGVAMAR